MADKVMAKGKSTSHPSGILKGSGDASTMKGPVYRDIDHNPRYRGGSSNPKATKDVVVG